jgi:hypothetical protein
MTYGESSLRPSVNGFDARKRIVLLCLAAAAATFIIAAFYPLGRAADDSLPLSFAAAHGWLAAQSISLTAIFALPLMVLCRWFPRAMIGLSTIVLLAIPVCFFLDCVVFHRIGERFFSATTASIASSLLPGLLPYVDAVTLGIAITAIVCVIALSWLVHRFAAWASARWSTDRPGDVSPWTVLLTVIILAGLISIPSLIRYPDIVASMKDNSTRHPWCAFRMVGYRSQGMAAPSGPEAVRSGLYGLSLADGVSKRLDQLKQVSLVAIEKNADAATPKPDIVIFIVESLRPEVLTAEVMPHLFECSERSLLLRNHVSGGNSSNLGIFSLVNGLEATWFPYADQFEPLLNRLLHLAGYQIGFFGGSEGWDTFNMEGFINDQVYDEFVIEPVDWNASDERAIERASAFLDKSISRQPRCAVVYLYSTHAPFHSAAQDQIFEPWAAEWNVSLFTNSGREQIVNRYRNAAHFVDRIAAPLIQDDRIIVLAGDHGESLLDDGTIGHGTRLSKAQTFTPAFIHVPGASADAIEFATSHIDLLPTLISTLGYQVLPADALDGIDLNGSSQSASVAKQLESRTFASHAYIGNEVLLIGPWTTETGQPLGYRNSFSLDDYLAYPLGPVDAKGLQLEAKNRRQVLSTDRVLRSWIKTRHGIDPIEPNASREDLFARHLKHTQVDVRLAAITLASKVQSPNELLISLIQKLTLDPNVQVRRAARNALVTLQRRRSG